MHRISRRRPPATTGDASTLDIRPSPSEKTARPDIHQNGPASQRFDTSIYPIRSTRDTSLSGSVGRSFRSRVLGQRPPTYIRICLPSSFSSSHSIAHALTPMRVEPSTKHEIRLTTQPSDTFLFSHSPRTSRYAIRYAVLSTLLQFPPAPHAIKWMCHPPSG